jgi:hypothetical protein
MREDLPDRPRIGNERDESDVATTPRARNRKLLTHPRHQFRPRNPGGVVGGRFVDAPLIDQDGQVTGALMVCLRK